MAALWSSRAGSRSQSLGVPVEYEFIITFEVMVEVCDV